MTIGSALASAMSGLTASARLAEVASNNIANALNESFAKRQAVVSARTLGDQGAGVKVQNIVRSVDELVLGDLRLSTAAQSFHETETQFLSDVEGAIGAAQDEGSIANRIAGFETALVSAQSRPESETRLQAVLDAAKWVASGLNDVSNGIQSARQAADGRIAELVDQLNSDLQMVADLNAKITRISSSGRDTTALEDQRQEVIDRLASVVPLREEKRANSTVALFSSGGLTLLDGRPAVFDFSATNSISPDLAIGAGLSTLRMNGQDLRLDAQGGRIGAGELSAQFDLRDRLAPDAQAELDGLARDLIERMQDPTVDPTLAGGPGLFTDGGALFAAVDEAGIASRIAVNSAALPEEGGALWRLRAGLGAATAGDTGDGSLLVALGNKLAQAMAPASASLTGVAGSVAEIAATISSNVSQARLTAERAASFSAARYEALKSDYLENGVDTDEEMQTLMLIEQAYAANARVIQTADAMMQAILEI